jgi:two-component system, NtrC family, sensor kinase
VRLPVWNRLSIRTKIIATVAVVILAGQLFTALLIRSLVNDHIVTQKIALADVLTTSVLHDIKYYGGEPLANGPAIIAKYMTYYRDITRMTFYNDSLRIVATSEESGTLRPQIDRELLDAARRARPALHARRSPEGDLEIRSLAPVMQGSRIAGTLELNVSIRDVRATLAAIDTRIGWIMGVKLLLVGIVLFFLLQGVILGRLGQLMAVAKSMAAGKYETHVHDTQQDEIGALGRAFNTMADEVKRSKDEIEAHNRGLRRLVEEATAEVVKAYEDLKSAQSQLVLNEKMASLGVLIAGIAHEINTPVGAILNVSKTLDHAVRDLPQEMDWLRAGTVPFETAQGCLVELVQAASSPTVTSSHRDLRAAEEALRECGIAEYRSLAASLARFNFTNPERVRHYSECLRQPSFVAFAESVASIAQATRISESSSEKIGEIVRALKYYAYSDKDRVDQVQINESVQTALVLLRNQLKHAVQVTTDYETSLPSIPCSSDIHQVWTNLLTNAVDAVEQRNIGPQGKVEIETKLENDAIRVRVADNGVGVPEDLMGKIFDPFFTTKDIGKGTGLGLCIVAGIVKRHGGAIDVESVPGRTVFTVRLPLSWKPEARQEEEEEPIVRRHTPSTRRRAKPPQTEAA